MGSLCSKCNKTGAKRNKNKGEESNKFFKFLIILAMKPENQQKDNLANNANIANNANFELNNLSDIK